MLKSIATFTITMLLITPVASAAKAKKPKIETKAEEAAPAEPAATPAATTTTTTTTVNAEPAAPETPPTTTTTTTTTTTQAPPAPEAHAWDAVAGGVVANTWTLRLDALAHYYLFPTLGAAYALNDMVEIGASISVEKPDVSDNYRSAVELGYNPGIYAQLPIRFSLLHGDNHSLGVKVSPGISIFGFGRGLREVSLLVGAAVNYGYWVVPKTLLIGGGIDVFSAITLNPTVQFRAPVLAGVVLEYNFHEHFGIFGEAKVGPVFDTFGNFAWSQRILFGLAAHL